MLLMLEKVLQLHSKPVYYLVSICWTFQTLYYGSEKISICYLNHDRQTSVVIPGADCFITQFTTLDRCPSKFRAREANMCHPYKVYIDICELFSVSSPPANLE